MCTIDQVCSNDGYIVCPKYRLIADKSLTSINFPCILDSVLLITRHCFRSDRSGQVGNRKDMCVCRYRSREHLRGQWRHPGARVGTDPRDRCTVVGGLQRTRQCDEVTPMPHIHWWIAARRRYPEATALPHSCGDPG